jgi:hypothetical protein
MNHTICSEVRDNFKIFLDKFDIICASDDYLPFNPFGESPDLLKSWMQYRGNKWIEPTAENVIKDLKLNGNFPSFAAFRKFNSKTVSLDFLERWLSWYGVGSVKKQPKTWYVNRVEKLKNMLPVTSLSLQEEDFAQLLKFRTVFHETSELFFNMSLCFDTLTKTDIVNLNQKSNDKKQSTLDLKKLLAVALDASAVALPLVITKLTPKTKDQFKWIFETSKEELSGDATLQEKFKHELKKHSEKHIKTSVIPSIFDGILSNFVNSPTIGSDLHKDLKSAVMTKSSNLSVLRNIIGRYFSKNPHVLRGLTDVVIPSIKRVV